MRQELWELREAQLETQMLELLQGRPMTVNALRKKLNVSAKLVARALERHKGICVEPQEDGRWVLLEKPSDVPDDLVFVGDTALSDKLFAFQQKMVAQGVKPMSVGFSKKINMFYWDEWICPLRLKPGDRIVFKDRVYQCDGVEDLGVINHHMERGHYYRILCQRPRFVAKGQKVVRRNFVSP